jgi:hypothetical protein
MHPGSDERDFVPSVRHGCGRVAGRRGGNKRNRSVGPGCYGSDEPRQADPRRRSSGKLCLGGESYGFVDPYSR